MIDNIVVVTDAEITPLKIGERFVARCLNDFNEFVFSQKRDYSPLEKRAFEDLYNRVHNLFAHGIPVCTIFEVGPFAQGGFNRIEAEIATGGEVMFQLPTYW